MENIILTISFWHTASLKQPTNEGTRLKSLHQIPYVYMCIIFILTPDSCSDTSVFKKYLYQLVSQGVWLFCRVTCTNNAWTSKLHPLVAHLIYNWGLYIEPYSTKKIILGWGWGLGRMRSFLECWCSSLDKRVSRLSFEMMRFLVMKNVELKETAVEYFCCQKSSSTVKNLLQF